MPYTLKPNKLFVKDPNGNGYLPQNVVTDRATSDVVADITAAGTTQTNRVNSAGATQITAIENKATELDSKLDDADEAISKIDALDDIISGLRDLLDLVHPVGSVYISLDSTNPGTMFGGTWVQIQDTFLLAAGQTYSAGATGGEAAHTLSYSEMPEHAHYAMGKTAAQNGDWTFPLMKNAPNYAGAWGFNLDTENADYVAYASHAVDGHGYGDVTQVQYTGASGDGQAHNNMPPYLAVYMWRRTA